MNTLIRYLVLSEITVLTYTINHPLFRTIRDLMYGCACVWAFFIRPSIVSSGNGWIFSDFRSIYSSLTGCLWGVCNTPLHGYTYLIDGWCRCFQVGAYCIRPTIVSSGNKWTFLDYVSIHLSLTGCLWGVCNTPLPRYAHLIDGWYRCAYVGAYCIRPSIISNKNG